MAYLTTAILEQESSWFYTAWQPQIASSAAFDTWIGTIVNRAANQIQWRVGAAQYTTTDPLVQGLFQEAELCYAQYYLCMASAALADTSDDVTQVPMIAHGDNLRADAAAYLARCMDLVRPYDLQRAGQSFACPAGDVGVTFPEGVPQFDAVINWARTS